MKMASLHAAVQLHVPSHALAGVVVERAAGAEEHHHADESERRSSCGANCRELSVKARDKQVAHPAEAEGRDQPQRVLQEGGGQRVGKEARQQRTVLPAACRYCCRQRVTCALQIFNHGRGGAEVDYAQPPAVGSSGNRFSFSKRSTLAHSCPLRTLCWHQKRDATSCGRSWSTRSTTSRTCCSGSSPAPRY
jgi:hypothetical protein